MTGAWNVWLSNNIIERCNDEGVINNRFGVEAQNPAQKSFSAMFRD